MAYSYFDVKKEYDQWQGNKDKIGLSEYAQTMDRMTGSTNRQAAYNDGIMTKLNAYIDKGFEPISEPLRPIGEAVGQKLNEFTGGAFSEELPEKIGDLAVSLPRTAVEFAPWFAPLKAGKAVNLAAKGATMASSFVRGTAETGTPVGGFISAGTLPVMPAAGRAADRFVGKRVAKGLAEKAGYKGTRLGKELTGPDAVTALSATGKGSLRRYGASQVAIGAVGTASDVASATAATGSLSEGLKLLADSDYYAMQVVGQVPFLGLDAVRLNAEIQSGRAISAEGAARRAKLFDTIVVHDEAQVRNQQLDEIAQRYQETIGAERPKIREEFRAASEGIVKDPNNPKAWVSSELWLKTNEYRFKTPEEAIALMRTYNDVVLALKKSDNLTQGDIIRVKDELFGDGPVTAERLQKAFDNELADGADINEATLHIMAQVQNRLGRKTADNVRASRLPTEAKPNDIKITGAFPEAGNFRSDIKAYAMQQFENAGLTGVARDNYVKMFEKTAELFPGETDDIRVGLIRNEVQKVNGKLFRYLGLFMPGDVEYARGVKLQERMIGLLDKKFSNNKLLNQIVKLSTVNHELLHAWVSKAEAAYKAGTLSHYEKLKYQQYKKAEERFSALSEADRLKMLRKINDTLLSRDALYNGETRDVDFEALEIEASKSGKETLTMVSQMASLASLSPNSRINDIRNELKWLDDEVTDFANLQFRSLKTFLEPLANWFEQEKTKAVEASPKVIDDYYRTTPEQFFKRNTKLLKQFQDRIPVKMRPFIQVRLDPVMINDKPAFVPTYTVASTSINPGRPKLRVNKVYQMDPKMREPLFNIEEQGIGDVGAKTIIEKGYDVDLPGDFIQEMVAFTQENSSNGQIASDFDFKTTLRQVDELAKSHQEISQSQQSLGELGAFINPTDGLPDIDLTHVKPEMIEAFGGVKEAKQRIKKAMGMYSDEDLFIKHGYQLGNIERLLGNPSQMSSSLRKRGLHAPADVIDYVQNIPAAIENLRTRMVKPFLTVSKQGKLVSLAGVKNKSLLSTEEQKMYNALQVILNNDNANQAFTDIALLHGTLERALNHDDPGFKEAVKDGRVKGYDQLDSDGKTNVWHAIKIVRAQNQQAAQLLKMAEYQKLAMFATKAFRIDNPDVSTKEGFQLMLKVFRDAAINREIMGLDPEQMGPAALAALKQVSPQLNLKRIEQLTSRLLPKYFEVMSLLDEKQEYFFSERRVGEWLHTYKRKFRNEEGELDTETVTVSARTKKDLDALIRKLEVEDNPIPGTQRSIKKSDLVNDQLPASRDKFLETVRPLENAMYESALEILGEAEAQKMRELYQPLERTIEQAKKEKLSSFFKPRKLRPGREYIDMFDTAIDYYNSLAYKLANDEAKGYADMMLQDPQMEAHPQLRNDVMQWADNLTKRKSKEYHTLKNGIFTYFLGFNPSSMMIEMAQPIITTTPIIIEEIGGHIGKAHKMLGAAYKTLGKAYSHERAGNGRLVFQDKMLEENFNKAIDERIMEYGSIEELSTPEELMNTNAWRLQQGLEGMSTKEMLTQPLHYFSKYGRGLYSTVSGLNAKISYIIGHEIAVSKGMKGEDAHNFAKGFIRRTTHSGGEYNRAMGFSKLGKAQSSVSVAYTLNNFTFATLHMMSRLFKDAIGTSGLGKPEQRAAQKALATMLTGQFALAGALGMPFAGAAITILEDLFDTTIRDDIRTTLASISGDTEHGAMFADVATRGLPTLLGVDAQSRFGLGSVLGFSEYQGFDATGFLGAAGGIVENLYKGVAYGAQGELSKGIQSAVPQALKRPIEMYRNKGKYLDAKGELLIEPNTAEQIAYLIGFRPKRFSDIRLMQRVNRTADDIANRERRKSLQRIAENFQQKSGRQIRAEIQELMQNDPMFQFDQFDDIVNRLTDIVMESQVPVDPMRTGSYASLPERERFAQTLPKVRQGGITESQRIALQNIIKTTITGQQQVPNRRQVTRAQMLDEFLKQNPTMSPQRARAEIGI